MGQSLNKFILLFWKNWLLQIRHPIQTLVEIVAPVLFTTLLVLVRSLVEVTEYPDGISFPPFSVEPNKNYSSYSIAWSPYNPILERIMNKTVTRLHMLKHVPYNSSALLQAALSSFQLMNVLAGVAFDDSYFGNVSIGENLVVTIRFPGELRTSRIPMASIRWNSWLTNHLFPIYQTPGPRAVHLEKGGPPSYCNEGFLALQQELSFAILEHFKGDGAFKRPTLKMQRYPYPRWIDDFLLTALQSFVGLIIMLSFVYTCINTVRIITTEKEKQLKEMMKIMGLPRWLHWTAWFVKEFIFLQISIVLIVVLMKGRWYSGSDLSVFTESDGTVIYVLLMLFTCATITFSFLISVFFSKANVAATIAGMAWFLTYVPFMSVQKYYDSLSLTKKLSLSIFSNTAVSFGFQLMVMFEGNGEGFQWNNIWETASPDDDLVLGHIFIMLIVDAILYLLLAIYIEAVFPGKYGVPQKWYFPFICTFWCGKPHVVDTDFELDGEKSEFFEKEPKKLKAGIRIKHLHKVYSNQKVAVRNLTLNMYEGQITVLLGHNGAGKTTTMSMLTGMFPPTSGTAIVAGYDIRTDMEGVRKSLGLCPQHNVLFDELTVKEHFYFYTKLKGMKSKDIKAETKKYIGLLELTPKKNSKVSTLSGGMKRKLCVGIALCGKPRVVMLDEPTAGVDPSARRTLWDILQEEKKGRTMLLTTHFMDEADLLGDRIAIMAGGKLQCCGSSFFLKKKYGAGYHLIIDKEQDCNVDDVTKLLNKYLPKLKVDSNVGSELTYTLDESGSQKFEKMLSDLENNKERLKIRSFGISLTTLEEVFMKVGADHGQEETNDVKDGITVGKHTKMRDNSSYSSEDNYNKYNINMENQKCLRGFPLWGNQFIAMFLKRVLSTYRSWTLFLIQVSIPVVIIIITVTTSRRRNVNADLPSLDISLNSYENPVTVVSGSTENKYYEEYKNLITRRKHLYTDYGASNLSEKILELTSKNLTVVRRRYIVAASFFSDNSITALFNNVPYHTAPLSLDLVINAIFQHHLGSSYSVNIVNHPLPYSLDTRLEQLLTGSTMGFQVAFNMGFAMACVSSFYVMFYIRERVSNAKHLQFVSGANVITFWTAAFLNDAITFTFTVFCALGTLAAFQEDGFKTLDDMGRLFSLFLCFIFSVLPLTYLASFCFTSPASGYTRMTLINIFTGIAAFLIVEILSAKGLGLEHIAEILHWIFLPIPHYSLSTGIIKMHSKYSTYTLCNTVVGNCTSLGLSEKLCWKLVCSYQNNCCNANLDYYSWEDPGVGRNVILSICTGVILIAMLLFIEYSIFAPITYAFRKLTQPSIGKQELEMDEDADVFQEKQRIRNSSVQELRNYSIAMRDVTKYYKKFLAVNKLCLTVDRYECFGLLGVNGAGKTTTFKILTGDIHMSSGEAWVNGISLKGNMKEIYKKIGYCPQFDALLDELTGRETLRMFCLLRGFTVEDSKLVARKLANNFDFYQHLDKKVREYSGGNKRKLSSAVALIGNPLVIYLDEPSTGMDPASKRHLWNALCKIRDSGKCLVLTTHSMEECEALCTRLAIMVNGTFKCIGSVQHLKSKFSEGYKLNVKIRKSSSAITLNDPDVENVKAFVETNFPGAVLQEEYQELLCYYIKDRTMQWSKMFGIMERGKKQLNIEDYSLGQSNLEQVFLYFTKLQRES